ncbi:unnamed protein product [Prorocentrum cordatum]|uniref:DDE Tnp4 domain-containing protein n=1 Tax=Prorocentrum cordatum TaxID=2364126 RepID=A0ABN9RQB7_9DINO|nr:unnamed protein product [Polarella glacialis]
MPHGGKASQADKHKRAHRVQQASLKRKPACATLHSKKLSGIRRVSLTKGSRISKKSMMKKGRAATKKEAPGPSYIPPNQKQADRPSLAALPISKRIAVVDMARVSPELLARIMIEIGVLPDLGGECTACQCGTMELKLRGGQSDKDIQGGEGEPMGARCTGMGVRCSPIKRRESNLDPKGPLKELFNKGSVNTTRTLLAIAHAATQHASGYESSDEMAVQVGISKNAAQRITSVVRSICARVAKAEQDDFVWPRGCLVEADEASMRACRVTCPRDCCDTTCGEHPFGRYRILHHRFMCVCPRGQRQLAMFFELPQRTCAAGGSGVSLSGPECDEILPWVLVPGNFTLLTDGAGACQSVAPKSRAAYSDKSKDPPRFNADRFKLHYKHLKLSHGIVSHDAEQWAVVDRVRVVRPNGRTETLHLKKGTQCCDGLWPEMRDSIPDSVHTSDWERCRSYLWAWVWRMRRSGNDLLQEFGQSVRRERGCMH